MDVNAFIALNAKYTMSDAEVRIFLDEENRIITPEMLSTEIPAITEEQVSDCLESACEEYDVVDNFRSEHVPTDVALNMLWKAIDKKSERSHQRLMGKLRKLERTIKGEKVGMSARGSKSQQPGGYDPPADDGSGPPPPPGTE